MDLVLEWQLWQIKQNIRAAMCYSAKNTQLSRLHNNANIITLGARLINKNKAYKFINIFIKLNLKAEDTKED